MSANKITSYRWEITDFQKQFSAAKRKNEDLASDVFALVTRPSIQFALFFNPSQTIYLKDNTYGVILKKCGIDQLLNFDVKIWMEDDKGQRFGEYSAQNHAFKTVGDQCGFNLILFGNDWDLFTNVCNNNKTMFICCELLDLNSKSAPVENCDDEFYQNQWASYEEELHDAVIKVNDKEFKVSKIFFMSQSSVFKSMFMSKFKEGVTSEIQANDVDEDTMNHLVKWIYTNRLEEDSPIETLFSASDKYDIKILKNTCIQRMVSTFSNLNAFGRLVLSVIHSNEILKNASLEYIDKVSSRTDFMNFFTSSEWDELKIKNAKTAQEVKDLLQEKMKK